MEKITYNDARGNIKNIQRNGLYNTNTTAGNGGPPLVGNFGTIDNLTYNYINGKNQITNITDAMTGSSAETQITNGFKQNASINGTSGGYVYDANGNMINDYHKGITIVYNYLNLPQQITFSDGKTITFTYDATGKKWRKTTSDGQNFPNVRDYIDGVEYTSNKGYPNYTTNVSPDIIHFSEGYVQYDASTTSNYSWQGWVYKYALRDHLGNTRVVFSDRNDDGIVGVTDIEQINNYYPFGMNMDGPWNGASGAFKYQYNGKEFNSDFGLNWNDYGARFYDPAIGRWNEADPLAEKMRRHSPYNYGYNNPMRFVDPDGRQGEDWVIGKNGIRWDHNATSQSTTQAGEIYLGKKLAFFFNSYIDPKKWDGPLKGDFIGGNKLLSTILVNGSEDPSGKLTVTMNLLDSRPGPTPIGSSNNFYPGLGDDQNKFETTSANGEISSNFEHHNSVSNVEAVGLNVMGYNIVNVAQKLNINYSGGNLNVSAATDIFPSATLTVNGITIMQYDQPSFKENFHLPFKVLPFPSEGTTTVPDYTLKPAIWYSRQVKY